jgi:cell wall-associated NlpC family hydrolase
MDGIAGVQARIASIQARFSTQAPGGVSATTGGGWTNAASAASSPASASSFAQALQTVQSAPLPGAASLPQQTTRAADGLSTARTPGAAPAAGAPSASAETRVVAEARKYLGVPYLWGGTDPAKGLDCSGLTQLVFKNMGIDIPRVSYEQAKAGRPVASVADARPGDLVFYDNSSSRPGIDHVAIYIGGGKIIEAPRTGLDVRVTDVGNPVSIRRVLPADKSANVAAAAEVGPAAGTRGGAGVPSGLQGVPYADLFVQAGAKHGVPAALLAAVAKTESAFNPQAVSPAGARGLMQFMPGTAADLGINPLVPSEAVNGAARYLATHLRTFGSVDVALAAYNAGPGAVQKYGGIPPYEENQNNVRKVNDAWKGYR